MVCLLPSGMARDGWTANDSHTDHASAAALVLA